MLRWLRRCVLGDEPEETPRDTMPIGMLVVERQQYVEPLGLVHGGAYEVSVELPEKMTAVVNLRVDEQHVRCYDTVEALFYSTQQPTGCVLFGVRASFAPADSVEFEGEGEETKVR